MRIVNNKIYIVRGETPTYSARIIDKETGAPLIIDKGIVQPNPDKPKNVMIIEFVVRDSVYNRDDDLRMKYNLILTEDVSYHVFDDSIIRPYNALGDIPRYDADSDKFIWDDSIKPNAGDENRLHRYTTSDKENYYIYYDGSKWVDYEFSFDVTFAYGDTSVMEAKTYVYEIALFGGALKQNPAKWETIVNPIYMKPLLGATEFIVEESISG